MINAGKFKIFFKHSTIHAFEQKAWGEMEINGKTQKYFSLPDDEWEKYNYLGRNFLNGDTECTVENTENGVVIYKGKAECEEEDIFSREKGCYRALKNATKYADPKTRELLFKAFSNRKPDLSNKVLVKGEYYDEDFVYDLIACHTPLENHMGI